jgi:hypothetical protein
MVTITHTLFMSNFMGKSLGILRIASVVPDNQLIPLKAKTLSPTIFYAMGDE